MPWKKINKIGQLIRLNAAKASELIGVNDSNTGQNPNYKANLKRQISENKLHRAWVFARLYQRTKTEDAVQNQGCSIDKIIITENLECSVVHSIKQETYHRQTAGYVEHVCQQLGCIACECIAKWLAVLA